jgi:hypothetical protein
LWFTTESAFDRRRASWHADAPHAGDIAVLRARAAREYVEEIDDVLVFRKDTIVVEVDARARGARLCGKRIEEVDDILIFGKDPIVVEVDGATRAAPADE